MIIQKDTRIQMLFSCSRLKGSSLHPRYDGYAGIRDAAGLQCLLRTSFLQQKKTNMTLIFLPKTHILPTKNVLLKIYTR